MTEIDWKRVFARARRMIEFTHGPGMEQLSDEEWEQALAVLVLGEMVKDVHPFVESYVGGGHKAKQAIDVIRALNGTKGATP